MQAALERVSELAGKPSENDALYEAAKLQAFASDKAARNAGIQRLNALLEKGYRPSEVTLHIVLAHIHRREFPAAKAALAQLVTSEPSNERAAALFEIYQQSLWQQGPFGLALIGVGAAVVAFSLWWWLGRSGAPTPTSSVGAAKAGGKSIPLGRLSAGGPSSGGGATLTRPSGVGASTGPADWLAGLTGGNGSGSSSGGLPSSVTGLLGRIVGK